MVSSLHEFLRNVVRFLRSFYLLLQGIQARLLMVAHGRFQEQSVEVETQLLLWHQRGRRRSTASNSSVSEDSNTSCIAVVASCSHFFSVTI
jgi:hypothetical protein